MKVIASDLDRTLIPNGNHSLSKGAMELFKKQLERSKVRLVFVTGRYKSLIEDGIRRYNLPKPEYCVGLVGIVIYKYENGKLVEHKPWQKVLEKDCKLCRSSNIRAILADVRELRPQEKIKLHDFKQSYYVDTKVGRESILRKVHSRLKKNKINAEVIYSVDVNRGVGLVDVIPPAGTKLIALEYVLKKLMKVGKSKVMFSGDSGNDIMALASGFYGVLVKNATEHVKEDFVKIARKKKIMKKIHIAQGFTLGNKKFNGNYVSGIIEGAYKFGFFREWGTSTLTR